MTLSPLTSFNLSSFTWLWGLMSWCVQSYQTELQTPNQRRSHRETGPVNLPFHSSEALWPILVLYLRELWSWETDYISWPFSSHPHWSHLRNSHSSDKHARQTQAADRHWQSAKSKSSIYLKDYMSTHALGNDILGRNFVHTGWLLTWLKTFTLPLSPPRLPPLHGGPVLIWYFYED